tara:strand:- start:926 stop:1144 length:219 start_codon:yes stop_codon:yes gene_type:complete
MVCKGLFKTEAVLRCDGYSLSPRGHEDHPGPSFNPTIPDLHENLDRIIKREERLADEEIEKQRYDSSYHNNS